MLLYAFKVSAFILLDTFSKLKKSLSNFDPPAVVKTDINISFSILKSVRSLMCKEKLFIEENLGASINEMNITIFQFSGYG